MTDTLNHANLTTYDVPALAQFLQDHFGLRPLDTRGRSLAVLHDDRGFLLTLMFDKNMTAENGYPGYFHVGFLQGDRDGVQAKHHSIKEAGLDVPAPALLQRGGPPAYGFYCNAPGGVTVEVSTMNV